ncbi:kinesin motor domain protein [Necator americanus]|uniref:Kinesin-like protein n=1 Tax=Necator americanus TaxID=51031 RepID=W2T8P8_NECAM|nr:kinesin motor domain protein [Necator americanus]ETN78243.1 kinesin motor domain protein [Necator americanus]
MFWKAQWGFANSLVVFYQDMHIAANIPIRFNIKNRGSPTHISSKNSFSENMERIEVGMHVDIQRSDGRVHGAVVSQLKPERRAVLVEWFEKGETKGKEIDLASLVAINPTLKGKDSLSKTLVHAHDENNDENEMLFDIPRPNRRTVLPTQRAPPESSSNAASVRLVVVVVSTRSMLLDRAGSGSDLTIVTEDVSHHQNTNHRQAPRGLVAPQKITLPCRWLAKYYFLSPDYFFIANKRAAAGASAATTPVERNPQPLTMLKSSELEDINDTIVVPETKMKSSTVVNIEKLQKEREERRAQQNHVKKQKEMEKNIDPGNPNYQFLLMIRDYQSQIDYRPLKMTDQVVDNRISVCVRKRPLNKKEISKKEIEVITIPNRDHLIVHQPQVKVDLTKYLDNQKFRFDYTFDENTSNEMVYKFTAQPLVKTIFDQGFATCFAYGQTGSGKTHTMGGDFTGKNQNCASGIYALTASDVFKMQHSQQYKKLNLSVSCSFFEIYGGKVFDLLKHKALLRVLEDGKKEVQVVGLQEMPVKCESDVLDLIRQGTDMRTAGATSANSNSSRSHAVFQIILRRDKKLWGKFSLIDLAGNERGQDTGNSDRQTRMEGAEINKSLLALKECIRAMAKNSHHVPFRTSKLTLVLRDSFIGEKARTCMIAMISPGMSSCEHTINTLRYADRVKELGADEGGSSPPMNDEELMLRTGGDDADNEDADLSLVCSRNGTDKTTFDMMKIVSNLTAAEEEALYSQYNLEQNMKTWLKDMGNLITRSNTVDYDQEAYVRDSLSLTNKMWNGLSECMDRLKKWQDLQAAEAEMSKKVTRKKLDSNR